MSESWAGLGVMIKHDQSHLGLNREISHVIHLLNTYTLQGYNHFFGAPRVSFGPGMVS